MDLLPPFVPYQLQESYPSSRINGPGAAFGRVSRNLLVAPRFSQRTVYTKTQLVPDMDLTHQQVAVLVDKSFEDLEFWVPVMRLREEGADVVIAGRDDDETFEGKHGLTATTEVAARDLEADALDGIVVPGGWAPDKLRRDDGVTSLVHAMDAQNKIVAQICHAGLVGISAGIVDGRRATGSQGIKDDLVNAGAEWVDEAAFQDGNQVWGRVVKDIPAFCRALVAALKAQS